jgi:chain length determinant protein EpsF
MTLSQILLALKFRWRSAAWVLAAVLAAAALLTALQPRQYVATASVLLDVKSSDPIAGSPMQALAISGYMATQADIVVSERVIVGALRALQLDQAPATIARWTREAGGRGDIREWLYEQTLRRFEVLPSRESNVITISYTGADPAAAAALLNAIVKSYIATTLELRTEPARQYNEFFDDRSRQLRTELEQAQTRLSAFQQDAGVVANDERLDVENNRLAELSTQWVIAQTAATESGSRKRLGANDPDVTQEALASPLLSSLTGDLARQRAHLSELRTRLGERNPEVETAQANATELQERLNGETARVQAGLSMNSRMFDQKVAQLRAAVEAQRIKVLRLKSQRDQAAVIQRDVDNANRAYSAAYSRVGQASMESQATQTNVSLLRVASVPSTPSRPRVAVNMAVACVLGLLAAAGLALVREARDPRVRIADDVPALLQERLFAVLPDGAAGAARPRNWLPPTRRLIGRVPRPGGS